MKSRTLFKEATLLSETDRHGTIVFVNDDFCEVAKYNRHELLGKPHNIIRHPDMPHKLFEILWATIKDGRVFRGIIKNKAKDGSAYWVKATIMPLFDENKKIIKYLGVRYYIRDNEHAEALYAQQARQLSL